MLTVTLNDLRRWDACPGRYHHLLAGLDPRPGDDEPIPLTRILKVNGLDDTLWVLLRAEKVRLLVRFSADCAERAVGRSWPYPDDRRPQEAVAAGRKWADDPTDKDQKRACDAAARASFDAAKDAEDADDRAAAAAAKAAALSAFGAAFLHGPGLVAHWAQCAGCATDWIVERLHKMIEGEK